MKTLLKLVLFATALVLITYLGCTSYVSSIDLLPSITVLNPYAAEVGLIGQEMNIRWESTGEIGKTVEIGLYVESKFVDFIDVSARNSGAYTWSIPKNMIAGDKYRIKITSREDADIYGYSGKFSIGKKGDRYERDDSASIATSIDTIGTIQSHTISVSDTDWYVLVARPGRTYCIQTYGDANTSLKLYGANAKSLLATDTSSGQGDNGLIIWNCQTGGRYYFKVTSPSDTEVTNYSIDVRVGGAILAITYPSGEMPYLVSGDTIDIEWISSAKVGDYLSVFVYCGDTLAKKIVSSTVNDGFYSWIIPGELPTSSKYRIKIVSNNDTSINAFCGEFGITNVPASVNITTPSLSTTWNTGTTYAIYWKPTGSLSSPLAITLYDSNTIVRTIATGVNLSTGEYHWSIPSTLPTSSRYRIKIASVTDSTFFCTSSNFTIVKVPNTLTISSPSATTSWNVESTNDISWSSTGSPGNYISIILYDSTSSAVSIISPSYSTVNESYTWTVPSGLVAGKYKIRISSTTDTSVHALSSAFTITKIPSSLAITTPSISSNLSTGVYSSISWSSIGNPGSYISLTLCDSASLPVTNIATSYSTLSGSYEWHVPLTLLTGKYKIKISSVSDTSIKAFSSIFSITQTPGSLAITTPSAITSWSTGLAYSIYWSYTGNPGTYISLMLCDSVSQPVNTIITSYLTSNGSYSWNIPTTIPTGKYKIKITSTSDTSIKALSSNFSIIKTPSSLFINTPNSLASWNQGMGYSVSWSFSGNPGSYVKLLLCDSTSSPVAGIISSVTIASGSYYWTIPANLHNGKYKVKIISTSDTSIMAFSDLFTISKATANLSITTPSSTDNWHTDGEYYVYWVYTGNPGSWVNLSLYDSASVLITTIASMTTTANGEYYWTIPSGISTGKYKIKISSTTFSSLSAFGEMFTITKTPSSLAITSPSAMTNWSTGDISSVYWSSTGSPGDYVSLVLCDSASQPVTTLTSSYSTSSGSYSWTVPNALVSGSYKIKIASVSDTSIKAFSSIFSITKTPASLTITSPSATANWNSAASYYINWTYTGNPGTYVNLALYDSTSRPITTMAGSTSLSNRSYYWSIPAGVPDGKYRIKITSTSDTSIYAFSSSFPITKIPSTLSITAPAAMDNWITGTSNYIYWSYTGNPGMYVSLTLCDSASQPVSIITSSYSLSSGLYSWLIPSGIPGSSRYRIKITSTTDTTIKAYSNQFGISKSSSYLSVTIPGSTTNWTAGSVQTIFWAYAGTPCPYVKLSLYDSTALSTTINTGALLSNGYCEWTIPASLATSSRYRIKMSCSSDTSNAIYSPYFTIKK